MIPTIAVAISTPTGAAMTPAKQVEVKHYKDG